MFQAEVYVNRRRSLLAQMASRGAQGIAVFLGNVDAATNYRGNDYKFRQDSNFLYFWGVDEPWFAASTLPRNTAIPCAPLEAICASKERRLFTYTSELNILIFVIFLLRKYSFPFPQ